MVKIISGFIILLSLIFLVSSVSASYFSPQPNTAYNFGDTMNTSVIIPPGEQVYNFSANLICNSIIQSVSFPSQSGNIASLTNQSIPFQILLTPNIVGGESSLCQIRAILNGNSITTQSFEVSNLINVNISSTAREFQPGQPISVTGTAIKNDGEGLQGYANINVTMNNISVYQNSGVVTGGNFSFNFSLPGNSKAGQYLVSINTYETDNSGVQINQGASSFNILVDQVPTTLNVISQNNQSVVPGQTFSVEAILYDQSGQQISSNVNFVVKNANGEVIDQEQKNTGELFNIPVSYDDAPGTWVVSATSNNLTAPLNFNVIANPKISVTFLNRTILVTNVGNVPYNNPLLVELGNQSVSFNVSVGVDQSQKYVLNAPDGYYSVQVLSQGANLFSGGLSLTGNAVDVQPASKGVVSFVQYPLVWIALILILAVVIFFLFKRSHKKKFMRRVTLNRSMPRNEISMMVIDDRDRSAYKDRMIESRNTADLSLSIYGSKQNASIVCLDIKNFEEIKSKKGGVDGTMNRLKMIAENFKAVVYENRGFFFFIFAPAKTGTSRNELAAVQAADQIKKVLQDHNRLLKQKLEFGISVHYGSIVVKETGRNSLSFMSLGNFIPVAKKLASFSRGEVLLSKEIREFLMSDVRSEKGSNGDYEFYIVIEIKDKQKSEKFVKDFMSKMEKENRERENNSNY